MIKKILESFAPIIATLGLIVVLNQYFYYITEISTVIKDIASTSISLCGVLLGFLLTITTMLHTVNTRRMAFIKASGNFKKLINWLNRAIIWDIITLVFSLAMIIILKIVYFSDHLQAIFLLLTGLVTYSVALSVRFSIIFILLLADPVSTE